MDKSFIATILKLAGITMVCAVINILLYQLPQLQEQATTFTYSVATVYLLFFGFSVIILFALNLIAKNDATQVGYVFLGLTSLKVVGSYFLVEPILTKTISYPAERINFFAVFMLFLFIEAYFTAVLLNKKQ
jgi:hypothetical protein